MCGNIGVDAVCGLTARPSVGPERARSRSMLLLGTSADSKCSLLHNLFASGSHIAPSFNPQGVDNEGVSLR